MDLKEIAAIALDEAGYAEDVSLEEHDRRFHPNGYKDGQNCRFRREKAQDDSHDAVLSWVPGHDTDGKPGGVSVAICDITKEDADAIVNAANRWMLGGGGVDGAIHRAAGPALLEECKKYPPDENGYRVQTGDAKITDAGNLKAKYVIHTAGPDIRDPEAKDDPENGGRLLRSSYRKSLELAKKFGAKSVALPSISTGIFGYPLEKAAEYAAEEIEAFLAENPEMSVRMCVYDPFDSEKIAKAYTEAFRRAEKGKIKVKARGEGEQRNGSSSDVEDEAPEVKNLRHLLRTNAISKKEFSSSLAALAALGKVSRARIGLIKRQMFVEDEDDTAQGDGLPNGVKMTDNGDGTVTYSMEFSLDPEVQKEMSKAMPKGEKREDQVDKGIGNGEADAQDEAPNGVFAMALDEALGEDSAPALFLDSLAAHGVRKHPEGEEETAEDAGRHANTPLENCRAKDPRFCPYHGAAAFKKTIEDGIRNKLGNLNGISVDVFNNGRAFSVKVTTPKAISHISINSAIWGSVGTVAGVNVNGSDVHQDIDFDGTSLNKPQQYNAQPGEVLSDFKVNGNRDRESMLSEWADDLMIDVANDPQLQQEIDPKEFADFLGKLDAAGQSQAGTPAHDTALADAEKAYHMLRGQVEYKGVSSEVQLMSDAGSAEYNFNVASQSYHQLKSEVDAVKKVLFKNGKFPNGFAKANPFAAKYNAAAQGAGYFADKAFHDADDEYVPLMKALQSRKPTSAELQRLKGLVSSVKFGEKNYVVAVDNYFTAKKAFLRELYDWATGTMPGNGALRYHPSIIQRAFPKGRP